MSCQECLSHKKQNELLFDDLVQTNEKLDAERKYVSQQKLEIRELWKANLENDLPNQKTGWGEKHEAYRYRQIHPGVEKMGGWANFSSWLKEHAESYFQTCEKLENKIDNLERIIKSIPKNEFDQMKEVLMERLSKDCRQALKELRKIQ